MKTSAGVIPFRINRDGEMEFFVGHPGGKYNERKDVWFFLKGGVEANETHADAALREFKEETSLTMEDCPSEMLIPLGVVSQSSHKTVVAYGLHYPNIDPFECQSNYCEDGFTREIDRYQWMTYDRLRPLTHPSHLVFYKELLKMYEETKQEAKHAD